MFTPAETSIGAVFLQYATASYVKVEGKATSYSNTIYTSLLKPSVTNLSVLIGTLLSGFYVKKYLPDFIPEYLSSATNCVTKVGSALNYAASGLLVGFGAGLSDNATEGRYVSGSSKSRLKHLLGTALTFVAGTITATLLDSAVSCGDKSCAAYDDKFTIFNANKSTLFTLLGVGFLQSYVVLPYVATKIKEKGDETWINVAKFVAGLSSGFQFGLGLLVSGLASPAKSIGFFSLFKANKFDPSLLLVPVFTLIPNTIISAFSLPKDESEESTKKPILEDSYDLSYETTLDWKYFVGTALYGVGWGLSGLTPATALLSADFDYKNAAIFLATFVGGYFVGGKAATAKCNCSKKSTTDTATA